MIELEQHGSVELLRIAHGKANAFDEHLVASMNQALQSIEESNATALVISGRGSIFSAGVDLFKVLDGGKDYLMGFIPAVGELFHRLAFFTKPVVAAVNGHAIGGGAILVSACDYRLALMGPWKIGFPELRVGVPLPQIALEIARFALPPQHFQLMVYTGHSYTVDEALRYGVLDEVIGEQDFLERAFKVAEQMGAVPSAAFKLTKNGIRSPLRERLDSTGPSIDGEVLRQWSSPATHAAIRRYLEATLG